MKRIGLKSRRLELRPYRKSDFAKWRRAYSTGEPRKNRFDQDPFPKENCTREVFEEMRMRHERLAERDRCYVYGVFHRKTRELIGVIDISVIARDWYQMGNLGYRVNNIHWGKGYGKEAARLGLKIAFSQLGLNRMEAAINLDNSRSIALARGIGMVREGVKRRYIFEDGAWVDHLVFVANPEDIGLTATAPRN